MGPRAYREMEDKLVVKSEKEEGENPCLSLAEGGDKHGDTTV